MITNKPVNAKWTLFPISMYMQLVGRGPTWPWALRLSHAQLVYRGRRNFFSPLCENVPWPYMHPRYNYSYSAKVNPVKASGHVACTCASYSNLGTCGQWSLHKLRLYVVPARVRGESGVPREVPDSAACTFKSFRCYLLPRGACIRWLGK